MADQFEINGGAPPAGGVPRQGGDYFKLPAPAGTDGLGRPCGAAGYPMYELTFDKMPAAAFQWYCAFTADDPSVDLTSLKVYNPYAGAGAGAWTTYTTATMWRPETKGRGDGTFAGWFANVRILFTGLS